jgi:hypothetical protein
MAATAHKPGTPAKADVFPRRAAGPCFPIRWANPPALPAARSVFGQAHSDLECRENCLILMVF